MSNIESTDSGVLIPRNIDDAYRLAKMYQASKLLPSRYSSPEMIMTAIQFALELNLKPLTALRQIAVISGTPSLFGDLPLSLCFSSGKLEWIRESIFDIDGLEICHKNKNLSSQAFGALCIVKRFGDEAEKESSFTLDDAKRANLNSPVWKSYPQIMLKYRARSQALKDKFPDALNGISIAEYDFDERPTDHDDWKATKANRKELAKTQANELNELFKTETTRESKSPETNSIPEMLDLPITGGLSSPP